MICFDNKVVECAFQFSFPTFPFPSSSPPSFPFLSTFPTPSTFHCLPLPLLPFSSSSPSTFLFLFPFYLLSFSLFFSIIYIFRSYCWIHGTAYIRPHLQGKATGCFVDQSKIDSPEVRAS